jgi:hypothetical protein
MRARVLLPFAILPLGCDIHRQLGDDLRVEPVAPLAGAGTGSVSAVTAGRPTLRWSASSAAQTYHLQVDDSCSAAATCNFPSPEIDEAALTTTSYVPPNPLPAASTAPLSRPYYWRVQACSDGGCGEWSATRVFVVGQERTLNRDINGDGYPDFLVSVPGGTGGTSGTANVFLGGPTLPSKPALVLTGGAACDGAVDAVAMAGDVNGDGYGDYLVSCPGWFVGDGAQVVVQSGYVQLFLGGASLRSQPDIVFPAATGAFPAATGATLYGFTGGGLVGCGDLNADGYDDIAFTAVDYAADGSPLMPSRVEIHFGGPDMAASAPLVLVGESLPVTLENPVGYEDFGGSISPAGDINGDGYPDLIVGATRSADSAMNGGKVRIYFGGPQMDSAPDVVLVMAKDADPSLATESFGVSVAGLGDVNGDGFADVAVGAPGGEGLGNFLAPLSKVYVYFGGSTPHTSPDLVLAAGKMTEQFGTLVRAAGDADHDGYADIAVMSTGVVPIQDYKPEVYGQASILSGGPNVGQATIASVTGGIPLQSMVTFAVLDMDADGALEFVAAQFGFTPNYDFVSQVSIYSKSDGYARPARTFLAGTGSWAFAISP